MSTIGTRSAARIAADVDRGLAVLAQIDTLKKELDEIEERLTGDALARPDLHVPLLDEDREGKQFLATGSEAVLPIVLTADKLAQTFAADSKQHERIRAALPQGASIATFYQPRVTYTATTDSGKKFRAMADAVLGGDAPRFIAACRLLDKHGIPKSDIKLEWKAAAASVTKEVAA